MKNKTALKLENKEWTRHLNALSAKGLKPHPMMVRVHTEKVKWLSK